MIVRKIYYHIILQNMKKIHECATFILYPLKIPARHWPAEQPIPSQMACHVTIMARSGPLFRVKSLACLSSTACPEPASACCWPAGGSGSPRRPALQACIMSPLSPASLPVRYLDQGCKYRKIISNIFISNSLKSIHIHIRYIG